MATKVTNNKGEVVLIKNTKEEMDEAIRSAIEKIDDTSPKEDADERYRSMLK